MNDIRKMFVILTVLLLAGTVVGFTYFSVMEYQARAALPPNEQTAEAIETLYDGAVCLACDFGRVFFAIGGAIALVITGILWAIYETVHVPVSEAK